MDKKQLSKRDICTKFITHALEQAGWDIHTQVMEEFALTKGRVIVRGQLHTRAKHKRVDSRSKPLTIEEFDLEKKCWGGRERKGRKVTGYAWKISAKKIEERNYNLDCKNPHEVEVNHRDPEELMQEYQDIAHQLEEAQKALRLEPMAALGGQCMSNSDKKLIRNSTAEFLIFTGQAGEQSIEARYEEETIWLTQKLMATLFEVTVPTINEHLKNIFASSELEPNSAIRKFRITAADGKSYNTNFYNLDAIISVGYRVNSVRATQFRQWATQVLREFAIKGYVLDRARMENGAFLGEDYFERLLVEVREIRLSERRFYQKVTDIYATSVDYNKDAPTTKAFFAKVQNKLHFAIHGQTAAELITQRSDSRKTSMGLTTWAKAPAGKILKTDISIDKNYLKKEELESLGRIVNAYLDLAEDRARRKIPMTMEDWAKRLDLFLEFDERDILQDKGKVTAEIAKAHAESEFEKYRIVQDRLFESDFDKVMKQIEESEKKGGDND